MTRIWALLVVLGFTGVVLSLSELRWFRRPSLADRLEPYAPARSRHHRSGILSVESFREVAGPLSRAVGERLARLFGVSEELETRLRRTHAAFGVTELRMRQAGWAVVAFIVGSLVSLALALPAAVATVAVLGTPVLAFLALEQQVARASARWQRRIFLELPVVAEQLGMLLSAGWSLGAAIGRIAERGSGACSSDLVRVRTRMRQGLTEVEALKEWAVLADVAELHQLVSVLALNHEATDLGRLISDEARSIRKEAQRELIESIERRDQQVWIPVTVAALVPGVLLMSVPFLDALSVFSS